MSLNRRQFVVLTVAAAAGCKLEDHGNGAAPVQNERPMDAGPITNFAEDGVYEQYCQQGFFIIRRGDHLYAVSALCTHRACRLNVALDRSFYCKCHGSTFDANGTVTKGPATRPLPILPTKLRADGRLIVSAFTAE